MKIWDWFKKEEIKSTPKPEKRFEDFALRELSLIGMGLSLLRDNLEPGADSNILQQMREEINLVQYEKKQKYENE